MNNPFWVEEEDSEPSTSQAIKEKPAAAHKKNKPAKRVRKVAQKKKALLSKNPFASESSDSDGPPAVTTPVPKRKRNTVSDSEVRFFINMLNFHFIIKHS